MPNRKFTREQAIDVLMKRYEIGTIFAPKDDTMRAEMRVSCGSLIDEWTALGMLELVEEPGIDRQIIDVLDGVRAAMIRDNDYASVRTRLLHAYEINILSALADHGFKIVKA